MDGVSLVDVVRECDLDILAATGQTRVLFWQVGRSTFSREALLSRACTRPQWPIPAPYREPRRRDALGLGIRRVNRLPRVTAPLTGLT